MMQINIIDYLLQFQNQDIIYVPNPGNAGDVLIAYATLQLFDQLNINYQIHNHTTKFDNKVILYGGGGNLINKYGAAQNFLLRNHENNQIIVLPHTVYGIDDTLKKLSDNVSIICREKISYEYVKTVSNIKEVLLSHDIALLTKIPEIYLGRKTELSANCFRKDAEKTDIVIPPNNKDYSALTTFLNYQLNNKDTINYVANVFLNSLSIFKTINTNRVHIAIAGILLGSNVNLYNNSYFKCQAIFDHSLKDKYDNIKFMG